MDTMQNRDSSIPAILNRCLRDFGHAFKGLRARTSSSQIEFGDYAGGVKRQTISSWEQGKTAPDLESLLILKERLAEKRILFDIAELLGEQEPSHSRILRHCIHLLQSMETTGFCGIHENRWDALRAFCPFLERERESISIFASSFCGVVNNAPERVISTLKTKAQLVRVLLIRPQSHHLRATQEGCSTDKINNDIKESVKLLCDWGVRTENIRFYEAAPTIFLVFTRERMLANPYTYRAQGFTSATLELAPTGSQHDIFKQYVEDHFTSAWESAGPADDSSVQNNTPLKRKGKGAGA